MLPEMISCHRTRIRSKVTARLGVLYGFNERNLATTGSMRFAGITLPGNCVAVHSLCHWRTIGAGAGDRLSGS